jgi:hypothetical protein
VPTGLLLAVFLAFSAVQAPALGQSASAGEGGMILLSNDQLAIGFSAVDGSVISLEDRRRGVTYITETGGVPFRLDTGSDLVTPIESFAAAPEGPTACTLTWQAGEGRTLVARVQLAGDEVSFTSRLDNRGDTAVMAVEYPVLGGLGGLGDGDVLVHSYATGLLLKNPLRAFSFDGDGLRFMPYPESFSGASMQFFTWYAPGKAGLYFAAYDGTYRQKWLNFYRMGGRLEASLMYGGEDVGRGKGLEAPFHFVVKTFAGDDWYQAADIYKAWAVTQPWCAQGTLAERGASGSARWLLEDVGAATFGIDASHDRTAWIRRYHEDIGSPIFHILGPDWPKVDQNFYNSVPGGMADWFPTRFSKANLDLIRAQGDRVAPFEFDFLVDPNKSDGARLKANLQVFPVKPRSHDAYAFTMLCPATEFTRAFHVERDVRVLAESGVDAMYYDISANNLIKTCLSPDHGHPVGGGTAITAAYQRIYRETRDALSAKAGAYVPLGTEMMCETFLPQIDYYQARAWAQPSAAFETWPFHSLMKSGQAEMVPLFTYVYHEYGPQRLDGWGKLVAETGEYFHQIVARTYLWGGLYEINHEYSPMEALGGVETDPAEHYFKFDPQGFAYDASRAVYVGQFAALRTGAGNPYLAYGVMLKPPILSAPQVRMAWFHYNSGQKTGEYRTRGSLLVPSVLASAWRKGEGPGASVAFFLANTDGKEVQVGADIERKGFGLEGDGWFLRIVRGFGKDRSPVTVEQGPLAGPTVALSMALAPREVVMVEAFRTGSK